MFKFNSNYFRLSSLLLLILVVIAVFVNDRFIRPFLGDVLVVIWMYTFFKSFLNLTPKIIAGSVLAFACTVELLQYFELVKLLGLKGNRVAEVVIGSTFDWFDFMAYCLGCLIILSGETIFRARQSR